MLVRNFFASLVVSFNNDQSAAGGFYQRGQLNRTIATAHALGLSLPAKSVAMIADHVTRSHVGRTGRRPCCINVVPKQAYTPTARPTRHWHNIVVGIHCMGLISRLNINQGGNSTLGTKLPVPTLLRVAVGSSTVAWSYPPRNKAGEIGRAHV